MSASESVGDPAAMLSRPSEVSHDQYDYSFMYAGIRRGFTLKYAVPRRNIYQEIAEIPFDITDGRVIDLACGDGYFIRRLYSQHPSGLRIVGVDYSEAVLDHASEHVALLDAHEAGHSTIVLRRADITRPIGEESQYDAGYKLMASYHIDENGKTIDNLVRGVKRGALIVEATRGESYHQEAWEDAEKVISEKFPDYELPENWYKKHGPDKVIADLAARVTIRSYIEQSQESAEPAELRVPAEGWGDYQWVIMSLLHSMKLKERVNKRLPRPSPAVVFDAIEEVNKSDFDLEVRNRGYKKVSVEQLVVVCENTK